MTVNTCLCLYILLVQGFAIILLQAEVKNVKVLKYPNNVLVYSSPVGNTTATNKAMEMMSSFNDPNNGWTIFIDELGSTPIDNIDVQQNKHQLKLGDNIIKTNSATETDIHCQTSITTFDCKSFCSGALIFEDNFDSMDWKIWHHEHRIAKDVGDGEFVCFQNHPENCYVYNGNLHIIPTFLSDSSIFKGGSIQIGSMDLAENCTSSEPAECKIEKSMLPPVLSASIQSRNSFRFRYGRVEVRAKLPKGDWLFPMIQLDPVDNIYSLRNYYSGRLRIAFARGNIALVDSQGNDISGVRLEGGAIVSNLRGLRLYSTLAMEHLGNDFHNYTLTWTDEYIAFKVDGKEYAKVLGGFRDLKKTHNIHGQLWAEGEHMAPFDQEFYITLGVGVGGQADFPDDSINPINSFQKPWKNKDPKAASKFWDARHNWQSTWNGIDTGLLVDYVRVYAI